MNNIKKLMVIATIITMQQSVIAYDNSADDSQPRHQGLGRIFTAVENTVTLHPGNAVNSLATGNQSDTTFGWHEDDNDRIKANRAHTEHNNNKNLGDNNNNNDDDHRDAIIHKKDTPQQKQTNNNNNNNNKSRGHWFWKSSDNN